MTFKNKKRLVTYITKLAELDPNNCQLGTPTRLSAEDQSLTISLEKPDDNTWDVVKRAIQFNARARKWVYTSGVIEDPVPGFEATMRIPNTFYFSSIASIVSEGYCLLNVYVTLLELLEENEEDE